jgi:hypothetical protein
LRKEEEHKKSLKIMGVGFIITLIGIPADDTWHRVFGIDLTIWSPPHMFLYSTTFFFLLGIIRMVEVSYKLNQITAMQRKLYLICFCTVVLTNIWFPLLQQELGALSLYFFEIGKPIASPELLALISEPKKQILGGIPDWLYPIYAVFAMSYAFTLAKRINVSKFSATIVSIIYILYRVTVDYLFVQGAYQPSTIPYTIILAGVGFDIAYYLLSKNKKFVILAIIPIIIGFYPMSFIHSIKPLHPIIELYTLPFACLSGVLGFMLSRLIYKYITKEI